VDTRFPFYEFGDMYEIDLRITNSSGCFVHDTNNAMSSDLVTSIVNRKLFTDRRQCHPIYIAFDVARL